MTLYNGQSTNSDQSFTNNINKNQWHWFNDIAIIYVLGRWIQHIFRKENKSLLSLVSAYHAIVLGNFNGWIDPTAIKHPPDPISMSLYYTCNLMECTWLNFSPHYFLQSVTPTLKPISQKDLWHFWFDKSLKCVMGPPGLINNREQIFSWSHMTHIDKMWSVIYAKYMEKPKDTRKTDKTAMGGLDKFYTCAIFVSFLNIGIWTIF